MTVSISSSVNLGNTVNLGNNVNLGPGVSRQPVMGVADSLKLETNDFYLLEDDFFILLE